MGGETICLEWKNINYSITQKELNLWKLKSVEQSKQILNNVSGQVASGSLVAILGPSGAGKTTLLAAISQRIRGNVSGEIFVNGHFVSRENMIKLSAFVPQFDITTDALTVREHLYFMAELRMKTSTSSAMENNRINTVLFELGLGKLENMLIRSLSGGERKKLNLATELLTEPTIIFCDEPTTGLDSFNSLSVIKSLKSITKQRTVSPENNNDEETSFLDAISMEIIPNCEIDSNLSKAVICSIHQPTSEIFQCFTHIILMYAGRIAFQGSVIEAKSFFNSLGLICPLSYNPAEFYVKMVSHKEECYQDSGPSTNHCIEKIISNYEYEPKPSLYKKHRLNLDKKLNKPGWIKQVFILLRRFSKESTRNKKKMFMQSITFMITATAIALMYTQVTGTNQQSVQDIEGFFFTFSAEMIFGTAYSIVYFFPTELPIMRREAGENIYYLSAYYVSTCISNIPAAFINSFMYLTIIYPSVGFSKDIWLYLAMGITLTMTAIASFAYGCMLSATSESSRITTEIGPPIDLVFVLISGVYIKLQKLWFLKYFSVFFYAIEAFSILIWHDVTSIDCVVGFEEYCMNNGTHVLNNYLYRTEISSIWIDFVGLLMLTILMHLIGYLGVRKMVNKIGYY